MSGMDYRHCDACGNKAIYDAGLNWCDSQPGNIAIENNGSPVGRAVDSLGNWAVVCQDCARTHVARTISKNETVAGGTQNSGLRTCTLRRAPR